MTFTLQLHEALHRLSEGDFANSQNAAPLQDFLFLFSFMQIMTYFLIKCTSYYTQCLVGSFSFVSSDFELISLFFTEFPNVTAISKLPWGWMPFPERDVLLNFVMNPIHIGLELKTTPSSSLPRWFLRWP